MKQVVVLAIGVVTVMVTTGCSGKSRKPVTFQKIQDWAVNKAGTVGNKGADKDGLGDGRKCLNIPAVLRKLESAKTGSVAFYVSDLALGEMKNDFLAIHDEPMTATYFLKNGEGPDIEVLRNGSDLSGSTSDIKDSLISKTLPYLQISQDDSCESLKIKGKTFTITTKAKGFIMAEGPGGELISYSIHQKQKLVISQYSPSIGGKLCGHDIPPLAKTELSVVWDAGLDSVELVRSFASLLEHYLPATDLQDDLQGSTDPVGVSPLVYLEVASTYKKNQLKEIRCSQN